MKHSLRALVLIAGLAWCALAQAQAWDFWSATDLRRKTITMSTNTSDKKSAPVTLCPPTSPFICMKADQAFQLAVPKKSPLPPEWEFEGTTYKVLEGKYSLKLFGSTAQGVLIEGIDANKLESLFIYSPTRGIMAFQWTDSPKKRPVVFVIQDNCGPGAALVCK